MSSLSIVSLLTGFLTAMAFISETSDDGSNGGDPPKKPPKKHQEVITQKTLFVSSTIPNDLIDIFVVMVPRSLYPKMSLVSKHFHRLITSPQLYKARLDRNITESVLYGFLAFPPFEYTSCYILHRNQNNYLRLSVINSFSSINYGSAVVTIGHHMYVMGGFYGDRIRTTYVIRLDCKTHKRRLLPKMERVRYREVAGVIDGKIYVIGGREKSYWVEVFDVSTQRWSYVTSPFPLGAQNGEFVSYVVMKDKIYLLDRESCFSYQPSIQSWELCVRLRDFWQASSCVVDDKLYTIDPMRIFGSSVIVYDPEEQDWRVVHVVGDFPNLLYYESKMANLGGNLVILGVGAISRSRCPYSPCCEKNIWCVEIVLERCQGGEIRGKIKPATVVFTSKNFPSIELCRTITF